MKRFFVYRGNPLKIFGAVYLTVFSLLFANVLCAQAAWQWAHSVQGSDFSYFGKVSTDPSGNVFTSGGFKSSSITIGTSTLTNNGGLDIFLAKYDPSGNALWAKAVSPAQTANEQNEVLDMTTDALGNMYICGYFQASTISFDTSKLTNSGSYNAFVVKYDPSGNALWARKAGGSGNNYDVMTGVSVDNAGNVLVCGWYSSSDFKIGNIPLPNNGGNDSYLAKYDSSGNIIWAKQVSSIQNDQLNGIGADANGNVYVSGYSSPAGSNNPANITVTFSATVQTIVTLDNIYLAKYDPNGNVIWAVHSTGAANSSNGDRTANNDLAVDAAGNSYLTGPYDNSIQFGNLPSLTFTRDPSLTSANVYVAKYDSSGSAIWANGSGISPYCSGFDIVLDGSGSCYVTGFYQRGSGGGAATISFGNVTLTTSGIQSAFIVKYNPNGTVALGLTPTGPSNITVIGGDGVAVDAAGNIFAAGSYVNSSASFGNITLTNNGQYDGYIAKYQAAVVAPVANFIVSDTVVCAGSTVHFTDRSAGSPTGWSWTFAGGTPGNSSSQNPIITYDTAGTYNVRLVVSNAGGSDSLIKTGYITVIAIPVPALSTTDSLICASDSTLITTSGSYSSYSWSNGDNRSYTYADVAGGYWVTVTNANGCTAVSSHQNISVHPVPSVSIVVSGDTLSSFGGVLYQWYLNDTVIHNATGPVYIAIQPGNYAVQVTDTNGCKALSGNTYVVITGITQLNANRLLNVYPNPFTNSIFVLADNIKAVEVLDATGRIIITENTVSVRNRAEVNLSELNTGMYLLKVKTESSTFFRSIIKQ